MSKTYPAAVDAFLREIHRATGYAPGHLPATFPTTDIKTDLRKLARAHGIKGACVSDGTVTTDDLRNIYNDMDGSYVASLKERLGMGGNGDEASEEAPASPAPAPMASTGTGTDVISSLVLDADPAAVPMIDAVLAASKLPALATIKATVASISALANEAISDRETMRRELASLKLTASLGGGATIAGASGEEGHAAGAIPEGKITTINAAKAFGLEGTKMAALLPFDVPSFDWAFPHPDVPDIDPAYVFRPAPLATILLAITKGQQPWVHGHTGSGKSTLIEQIAARLHWPVKRVNFDSEITRMDLVGRDTLVTDPKTGQTVTKWEDGILPQALRGPYMLLLDELDFVRPDVAYTMQRIAEGKGLMLNENGGEYVKPHPMFRLFATANTVGQGDEHGMYQGARPQSMAFLDRFFPFVHVPYLSEGEEVELIKARVPAITPHAAKAIGRYVTEHRQAFTNAQVMQPLSPRGITAVADSFVSFLEIYKDERAALEQAFSDMVLAKATAQDKAVLKGLLTRVLK